MSHSSSESSLEPTRAGLGASRTAFRRTASSSRAPYRSLSLADSSSDNSDISSASSAPDVDASGLPSTFGGSKSRKRRRLAQSATSLPSNTTAEQPPGQWERNTLGFGSKILAKHGFTGRLGARGDGIVTPLQAVHRPAGLGLGAGGFAENPKLNDVGEQANDSDAQPRAAPHKEKKWKKKGSSAQKRLRAGDSVDNILDMRGTVPRQLPSVAAALADELYLDAARNRSTPAAVDVLFAVPEIAYDLRMLVDTARVQLEEAKSRRATEKLIRDTASAAHVKLREERIVAEKAIRELARLEEGLRKLNNAVGDAADSEFEAALKEFTSFAKAFVRTEFLAGSCVMDALAEVVHKRCDQNLAECMSSTNKQTRKSRHRQARHVCSVLTISRQVLSDETYITLCTLLVLQRARRVVARASWDAVEGAWVADVLRELRDAVPDAVVAAFAEDVLLPRLVGRLERWQEEDAPLHMWIHPWLPVVGRRGLGEVLGRVRVLLTRQLERWKVGDGMEATREVVGVLRNWVGVVSKRKMQLALARHVTPKVVEEVERFCSNKELVGKYSQKGMGRPECFERLEAWVGVISGGLLGSAVVEGMFVGLCRWMQGVVFGDEDGDGAAEREMRWKRGVEYYRMWKGWIAGDLLARVQNGLGAVLFVMHAGRIEQRDEVRRKLREADVRVLVRNRFVGVKQEKEDKEAGSKEAISRWRTGRIGLKDTVVHVCKREGLAVVGAGRASNGMGTLQVGRVRVALDGRRGVLLVVEGDGQREAMRVVSVDELIRMAKL